MSNLAEKRVEKHLLRKLRKKLSLIMLYKLNCLVLSRFGIAFVVGYFALSSGNETFMWAALGLIAVTSGYLYMKN